MEDLEAMAAAIQKLDAAAEAAAESSSASSSASSAVDRWRTAETTPATEVMEWSELSSFSSSGQGSREGTSELLQEEGKEVWNGEGKGK